MSFVFFIVHNFFANESKPSNFSALEKEFVLISQDLYLYFLLVWKIFQTHTVVYNVTVIKGTSS